MVALGVVKARRSERHNRGSRSLRHIARTRPRIRHRRNHCPERAGNHWNRASRERATAAAVVEVSRFGCHSRGSLNQTRKPHTHSRRLRRRSRRPLCGGSRLRIGSLAARAAAVAVRGRHCSRCNRCPRCSSRTRRRRRRHHSRRRRHSGTHLSSLLWRAASPQQQPQRQRSGSGCRRFGHFGRCCPAARQ